MNAKRKSGSVLAGNGKPIAAFDYDGTLIREQLLVLLSKECFDLDIFRPVAEETFKEVRLLHRDRKISFEDYDRQIIDLFTDRVKGRRSSDVHYAAKRVFEKNRDWLYKFTKALLEETSETHDRIAITGAMSETVSLLAPYWGFAGYYATELQVDRGGRYTGRQLKLPVRNKGAALRRHAKKRGVSLQGSLAIGDTMSDASMLRVVDMPIAFNPDDRLADVADDNGWPVVVERKDNIYVLYRGRYKRFKAEYARAAARFVLDLER